MTTRDSFPPFGARTVRLAVYLGWVVLGAGLTTALIAGVVTDPRVSVPLGAGAASLLVLSMLGWRNALGGRWATIALAIWAVLGILITVTVAVIPGMSAVALLWAFLIVSLSGFLAPPLQHGAITLGLTASYALTATLALGHRPTEPLLAALALLVVGVVVGFGANEGRRQVAARSALENNLRRRDLAFERLYEVITTLVAGPSLRLALPELVGRIGRYFRAQVGLVVLHNPDRHQLEVVSPIWTAGYSLEIDGYVLPLTGPGEIERVFNSGSPGLYHNLQVDPDSHSILGELGARTALCVPLQVENRTIGVLVLADKEDGDFDEQDLDALFALSGPAALVVGQLERIEAAAETTGRMEDLARMKTDFVSVVSHELRTPLTSIIGSLATLSRPELGPSNDQGRELLAAARTQADRLRRLIEDLLTASRIEHGALPHSPRQLDLTMFLPEVVEGIPVQNREISVEITEGAEMLVADPNHLSRVVINLVDNAIKYAGSGAIEIVAAPKNGRITISVIDHGSGIQLQERDHAFEQFTQLEPAQTRSQGGAGLGLSIVRGLVQAMGGTLDLTDTPGGGATFILDLPARGAAVASPLATQTTVS